MKHARARRRGMRSNRAFTTDGGVRVLIEESHELPLVELHFVLLGGSLLDPIGKEGLTRLMGRVVRMGTRKLGAGEVEDMIARLGARLTVETTPSYLRFHITTLRRSLGAVIDLLAKLFSGPAFRAHDVMHAKRETAADLTALQDNDRALVGRAFRQALFQGHPYGRPIVGTERSIRAITRKDLAAHWRARCCASALRIAVAGDVRPSEIQPLLDRAFGQLDEGVYAPPTVPAPRLPKGRRVILIDKPQRTQAQLVIGTLGSKVRDPDVFPLMLGNMAFGGSFTSRLVRDIRSERGWSYGAYSRLDYDHQRDAWYMWTLPNADNVGPCAERQIELLEQWVEAGVGRNELRFAKNHLVHGHCFNIDTASKRVEARLEAELLGLPDDYWDTYIPRIKGVRLAETNEAIRRRIHPRRLCLATVATASEAHQRLADLPGVSGVDVIAHDALCRE